MVVDIDIPNYVVAETETLWEQVFWSCQARDSSRPRIFGLSRPRLAEMDEVIVVETKTFPRVSLYTVMNKWSIGRQHIGIFTDDEWISTWLLSPVDPTD